MSVMLLVGTRLHVCIDAACSRHGAVSERVTGAGREERPHTRGFQLFLYVNTESWLMGAEQRRRRAGTISWTDEVAIRSPQAEEERPENQTLRDTTCQVQTNTHHSYSVRVVTSLRGQRSTFKYSNLFI